MSAYYIPTTERGGKTNGMLSFQSQQAATMAVAVTTVQTTAIPTAVDATTVLTTAIPMAADATMVLTTAIPTAVDAMAAATNAVAAETIKQ